MADDLQLKPTPSEAQPELSLDVSKDAPQISDSAMSNRVMKADMGLGPVTGLSIDDIAASFKRGQEKEFRSNAAEKVKYMEQIRMQNQFMDLSKTKPLTLDEATDIVNKASLNTWDPDTIIEKGYAGVFFKSMDMNSPWILNSDLGDAHKSIPESVQMLQRTGEGIVAQREYLNTLMENNEKESNEQSTVSFIADNLKAVMQPYNEYKMRGGDGWSNNLIGSAMQQKADDLLAMPLDQMKPVLEAELKNLNPMQQQMLLGYMVGQSTEQKTLDNIYGTLGLIDFPFIVKDLTKAGISSIRGIRRLFGAASNVSRDSVQASTLVPNVSPQTAQAVGVGDLRTAAVQQAAEDAILEAHPNSEGVWTVDTRGTIDPMKRARRQMPTVFRNDELAMKADPGNLGADFAFRMQEYNRNLTSALLKNVEETARINRIPVLSAFRAAFQKISEEVAAAYPADANRLMNVKGPIWDPFTNTWYVARILGRTTGEYFHSYGEAVATAKLKNWQLEKTVASPVLEQVPSRIINPPPSELAWESEGGATREPERTMTRTVPSWRKQVNYIAGAEIKHVNELGIQGNGYYVTDLVPVNETSPTLREFLGAHRDGTVPLDWTGGYLNSTIGKWIRGPDETQSVEQQIARKTATFSPGNSLTLLRKHVDDIVAVTPGGSYWGLTHKKQFGQWAETIRHAQDAIDPTTGRKGWFFESPGQLDVHYNQHFDRLPSEREAAAYFAFKRLWEADRWFRTQSLGMHMQRVGVQEVTPILQGPNGPVKLPPIHARRLDHNILPQSEDGILFLRDDQDNRAYAANSMPIKWREKHNNLLAQGKGDVYEIWNTEERPFQNLPGRVTGRLKRDISMGSNKIRYVYMARSERRPINLGNLIPRTFGGHLVPDYEWAIKRANVVYNPITNYHEYEGDKLAFFTRSHALGQEFADHLNNHQRLMLDGKEEEAMQYARQYLADAEKLHADYKPSVSPEGRKLPARWTGPYEPFQVVNMAKSQTIMDLGKEALEARYTAIENGKIKSRFRDGTRHGNLARASMVEFTGQRDAYEMHEVANRGTSANPMYHLDPAQLVEPMTMMRRGLVRIIHDLNMDDYKLEAMENWLFGKQVLDPATGKMVGAANFMKDPISAIQANPYKYFHDEDPWKTGFKNSKEERLLTADRMKINMFTGVPNSFDGILRRVEQDMVDAIYSKAGPEAENFRNTKLGNVLLPTWMIPKISNGPQAVRNALFTVKMAFFNPRMFPLHAITYMNAALIDPLRAAHGTFGALLHGYANIMHPDVLEHLDYLASKSGLFKPGDFKAFYRGAQGSGFLKVESGQHAFRDSPLSTNIIRSRGESFLHASSFPFRWGVTSVKTAAYYMAAAEWRAGRLGRSLSGSRWSTFSGRPPAGPPTKADLALIMNRADDLSHNMSRASSSAIQKGFTSFGAQFTSFNQRVIELLAGKRLTVPEKLRLFLGYGAFYGVPAAAGIIGLSTVVRSLMQGYNPINGKPYIPGEEPYSTILMEGLMSFALYKATGHLMNVGEAFGAKDLDFVDSVLNETPTFYDLFGGAALHGVVNTGESLTPFITWANTMLNDDDERFRLTPQHFIGVFKEISTVNYAWRAYMGVTTGRWLSRNWAYLNKTDTDFAILANIFGLQDQETADIYIKSKEVHDWRAGEAEATKWVGKEVEMMMEAIATHNYEEAKVHHMNAKVYLQGVSEENRARILMRIEKDASQTLKDKVDYEYYLGRDRPQPMRQQGINTYQRLLDFNKGKQ